MVARLDDSVRNCSSERTLIVNDRATVPEQGGNRRRGIG